MTLLELMVSIVVFTVCVSLLSNTVAATVVHTITKREQALAMESAQNLLEDIRRVPFAQVFATFNEDPLDDPGGAGTAPGNTFDVLGLTPLRDAQDGIVGRVILPAGRGPLREDVELPELGMPRDLNGDHVVDSADRVKDYVVLPVRVHIEWQGRHGRRELNLTTMLADVSRL